MTWTKLSDDWSDDCWTLSDGAHRLHADGLVWSNRKLLDLAIPKDDLPRLSRRPDCVQELLDGGWWSVQGDCYLIIHHADYQRTRAQVIKQQNSARNNGQLGGRPNKPSSKPTSDTERVIGSESERVIETGSLTHLVTGTETHRDRTGQDALRGSELKKAGTGKSHTKLAAVPSDASMSSCPECQRMSAFDSGPCANHRSETA